MRRPTGASARTGATPQERRYVRIFDSETRRETRLAVEKERGGAFTKVIVHHPDWVRNGTGAFIKRGVVDNVENEAAIRMLIDAGGQEVRAWLQANANGDLRRETFQVPAENARAWATLDAPRNLFLLAVVPRVRHRLTFSDVDETRCVAVGDAADVGRRRRVIRAMSANTETVTFVSQVVKQPVHGFTMYERDNTRQLLPEERTLNAVNAHSWQTLIAANLVDADTLEKTPQYVKIPNETANGWTYDNVPQRFQDLSALLAADVTFEEVDDA